MKSPFLLSGVLLLALSASSCPQGSGTTDNVVTHSVTVNYPASNCPPMETQFIQFKATNPVTLTLTKNNQRNVDIFTARMCFVCEKVGAADVLPVGVSGITATAAIPGMASVSVGLAATDAQGCATGRTTVRHSASPQLLCNDMVDLQLDQGPAGMDSETGVTFTCNGF